MVDFGGDIGGLGEKVVGVIFAKTAAGKRHVDSSIDDHVSHMHTFGATINKPGVLARQCLSKSPGSRVS